GRARAEHAAPPWPRLLLLAGLDADDVLAQRASHGEADLAVDECIQRVVLAQADVLAGMEARAALAHDDRARGDRLAAVDLHTEHLRVGIAAVARGTAALLVCHVRDSLDCGEVVAGNSGALAADEFRLELVEGLEV